MRLPRGSGDWSERERLAVEAMLLARYALVITDGQLITAEGDSREASYRNEIAALNSALHRFGIDTTRLEAPVTPGPDDR